MKNFISFLVGFISAYITYLIPCFAIGICYGLILHFLGIPIVYNFLYYYVPIFFLVLIIVSICLKYKGIFNSEKEIMSSMLGIILFSFPTINASVITYEDFGTKIIFGGIYPFGYSLASFFVKNVTHEYGTGYGNYNSYKFNPDVFTQLFQNQWVMLQAVSLIVAILFIVLYSYFYSKSIEKNKPR